MTPPNLITPGQLAPDFELKDINENSVRLSSFRGSKPVVLTFLRGFLWPYCRAQLARMRDNYAEFTARGIAIIAVGPDNMQTFQQYWVKEKIPYIGLPDPDHQVSKLYRQEVNLFKLGRMPLNTVLDINGRIRYVHFGSSMSDIPDNETFLNVIDHLNKPSNYVAPQT